MKRLAKTVFGFNAASLTHLIRLDFDQFIKACRESFNASVKLIPIPEINLDGILGERRPVIELIVSRYENGMLPCHEAMVLCSILVAEAPKEVLEIGTYMGYTARQMAENLKEATIHTVDLPENFSPDSDPEQGIPKDDFHIITRRVVGKEYKGKPCASRIVQHFADTASWDFHKAGHPTFFFIDGSHTYEYCKNDSEKCFELCGGRGIFLWHDCDELHPGVVKFITEWRRQGRDIKRISGTALAYWKTL